MSRIIQHTATGPVEVKPSDKSAWICMCGLSKNYPLCDGHHKIARTQEQPDKLYTYEGDTPQEIPAPGTLRSV